MKPLRRENRSRTSATGPAPRTVSFECSAELLRDFERRAFEQGCSVDWLLEEAMQRLLADEGGEPRRSVPPASLQQEVQPRASGPSSSRLPAPPDALVATLPPPPVRAQRSSTIAPPSAPPPSAPPPSAGERRPLPSRVAVTAPLVLDHGSASVTVDRAPFVIGRSPGAADFVIDDGAVSRRHAVIERTESGWVVTDLGSTNGIIVDGTAVRHAILRVGTVMSIGPLTFGVVSA
ncbi:MAG: domain containing protein [Labilithrix sp.]|nr:domain containing protein [Labilithrix sp.]